MKNKLMGMHQALYRPSNADLRLSSQDLLSAACAPSLCPSPCARLSSSTRRLRHDRFVRLPRQGHPPFMHVLVMARELVFASETIVATVLASNDWARMFGTLRVRAVLTCVMALEIGELLYDCFATSFCTCVFSRLAEVTSLVI